MLESKRAFSMHLGPGRGVLRCAAYYSNTTIPAADPVNEAKYHWGHAYVHRPGAPAGPLNVVVFGPNADQFGSEPKLAGYNVIRIAADQQWGKSSNELVRAMTDSRTIAVIA